MAETQKQNLTEIQVLTLAYLINIQNRYKVLDKVLRFSDLRLKRWLKNNYNITVNDLIAMYNPVNKGVVNAYNISSIKNSKTLKVNPVAIKSFKNKDSFKITRQYLKKTSISRRARKNARALTKIIKKGYDKGSSPVEISRKLDFKLGLRDKNGRLIKKGAKNGINYQTLRIARQETRRANGIAKFDSYKESKSQGSSVRMQLVSSLLPTSRQQSAVMNGQYDATPYGTKRLEPYNREKLGMFMYPDGKYYTFGQAPVQWSINDREEVVYVFPETSDKVEKEVKKEDKKANSFNL